MPDTTEHAASMASAFRSEKLYTVIEIAIDVIRPVQD